MTANGSNEPNVRRQYNRAARNAPGAWLRGFARAPSGVFLVTLLVVDAVLLAGHVLLMLTDVGTYSTTSLAASGGYAERVLQGKWLMLSALFVALSALWRNFHPLPFVFLSFYFWLADMTDLPIILGRWLRAAVGGELASAETVFGIPTIEIVSTGVHLFAFVVFLPAALFTWRLAGVAERPLMKRMAVAIVALGVFGIGVDVASASLLPQHLKDSLGDFVEDGGELVIGSFMLWVVAEELFKRSRLEIHVLTPSASNAHSEPFDPVPAVPNVVALDGTGDEIDRTV